MRYLIASSEIEVIDEFHLLIGAPDLTLN